MTSLRYALFEKIENKFIHTLDYEEEEEEEKMEETSDNENSTTQKNFEESEKVEIIEVDEGFILVENRRKRKTIKALSALNWSTNRIHYLKKKLFN